MIWSCEIIFNLNIQLKPMDLNFWTKSDIDTK